MLLCSQSLCRRYPPALLAAVSRGTALANASLSWSPPLFNLLAQHLCRDPSKAVQVAAGRAAAKAIEAASPSPTLSPPVVDMLLTAVAGGAASVAAIAVRCLRGMAVSSVTPAIMRRLLRAVRDSADDDVCKAVAVIGLQHLRNTNCAGVNVLASRRGDGCDALIEVEVDAEQEEDGADGDETCSDGD
jgi:hypothetical protein